MTMTSRPPTTPAAVTAQGEDDHLERLLEQPFETDHGVQHVRDVTAREIQHALRRIDVALAQLIDRRLATSDPDRLDHLLARIAALTEQSEELRVGLAWAAAKQDREESRRTGSPARHAHAAR